MTKKFNPKNSVCVITGGSFGIGQATAIELLNCGADKIINIDMHPTDAYPHEYYQCSVGNHDKLDEVLKDIISKHNVDLYHSNVGRCCPDNHEFNIAHWQTQIDVNFLPHVIAVRNFFPIWLQKNKGHMLITASAAALTTMPGSGTYAVTKTATLAYAEWLAMTYTTKGIGTTVLCPRGVRTNMKNDTEYGNRIQDIVGPWLEPKEVAVMTMNAIQDGKFRILTHEGIAEGSMNKAQNSEEYIKQLQQAHDTYIEGYDYTEIYSDTELAKKLD